MHIRRNNSGEPIPTWDQELNPPIQKLQTIVRQTVHPALFYLVTFLATPGTVATGPRRTIFCYHPFSPYVANVTKWSPLNSLFGRWIMLSKKELVICYIISNDLLCNLITHLMLPAINNCACGRWKIFLLQMLRAVFQMYI